MKLSTSKEISFLQKLQILEKESKEIKEEFAINDKKFTILCDVFDNDKNNNYDLQRLSIELNVIIAKSDELLKQIKGVNKFIEEIKTELFSGILN